jgi:HAD superfamily hydrolase (TIGR01509 family)
LSFKGGFCKVSIFNENESAKMKLIKAVIFDLGRVLVDVDIRRLEAFFCKQVGTQTAWQTLPRIMADPIMAQYSTGQIRSQSFYQNLCADYGLALPYEEFVFRWCDIFSPIEGMAELVAALSKKVGLGLLSDIDPLHWEYIQSHYPLMRYFPRPTLSFEVGVMKPHRAIYAAAAKHAGAEPAECLFIDDLAGNVDGAKAAGMRAIQFEGVGELRKELEKTGLL